MYIQKDNLDLAMTMFQAEGASFEEACNKYAMAEKCGEGCEKASVEVFNALLGLELELKLKTGETVFTYDVAELRKLEVRKSEIADDALTILGL